MLHVTDGSVRNATWDEIDLTTATWTIPPKHTKTGLKHRMPLSTGALTVLFTARQRSNSNGLIFPSPLPDNGYLPPGGGEFH